VERITAVNFFTAADAVTYTATIYDRFEGGALLDPLSTMSGSFEYSGFHTVDLDTPIDMQAGDDFYVYLSLSEGGHPYDRTSDVPVLLGASYRVIVESAAEPGQSYYYEAGEWRDLYTWDDGDWTGTGNFCIKALSIDVPYLYIEFPDGLPEYIAPGEETTINVAISGGAHDYVSDSGRIYWRYDGGAFSEAPLIALGGDLYEATLPPADCDDMPEFYFSADGDGGSTMTSPPDAPDNVYTAIVGITDDLMVDDFETDQGWQVSGNASAGMWERGVPIGGGDRGDPPVDFDGSGQCYLTQNDDGDSDVDGGYTYLDSPANDLTDIGDALVHFALWYTNNFGSDPNNDLFNIYASDNNGVDWVLVETVGPDTTAGWVVHEFWVSDHVALTDQFRVRFEASDLGSGSVVEAGVDDFLIMSFDCESPCPADVTGDGFVNVDDLFEILNHWGDGAGPYDINDDGIVNIDDLFELLNAWGPC
jgi:hypothetical protein